MEGTMLRYQNRGEDAKAFTEGYTLDALLIHYIACTLIGSIFGRIPLPTLQHLRLEYLPHGPNTESIKGKEDEGGVGRRDALHYLH